jgi:hypothetical protein
MTVRSFAFVVFMVSVLALSVGAVTYVRGEDFKHCQAAVVEQMIRAQNARSEAAAEDRAIDRQEQQATQALIIAVFSLTTGPERVAAFGVYRKTLDDLTTRRGTNEARRQANPLPAPPSETCR